MEIIVSNNTELEAAARLVNPGDTVRLKGGSYRGIDFAFTRGGEPGRPVTYLPLPGEVPVVDFGNRPSQWVVNSPWNTFEGIRFQRGGCIRILRAEHVTFRKLTVLGMSGVGIDLDFADFARVEKCYSEGNVESSIYLASSDCCEVRDCYFGPSIAYYAGHFVSNAPKYLNHDLLVEDCTFLSHGNTHGGGTVYLEGERIVFRRNVVIGSSLRTVGLYLFGPLTAEIEDCYIEHGNCAVYSRDPPIPELPVNVAFRRYRIIGPVQCPGVQWEWDKPPTSEPAWSRTYEPNIEQRLAEARRWAKMK